MGCWNCSTVGQNGWGFVAHNNPWTILGKACQVPQWVTESDGKWEHSCFHSLIPDPLYSSHWRQTKVHITYYIIKVFDSLCVLCVGEWHPILKEYCLWAGTSTLSTVGHFNTVRLAASECCDMWYCQWIPWSWAPFHTSFAIRWIHWSDAALWGIPCWWLKHFLLERGTGWGPEGR